jgi:hypothetical protein
MSDQPLEARSGRKVVAVGVGALGVAACVALASCELQRPQQLPHQCPDLWL